MRLADKPSGHLQGYQIKREVTDHRWWPFIIYFLGVMFFKSRTKHNITSIFQSPVFYRYLISTDLAHFIIYTTESNQGLNTIFIWQTNIQLRTISLGE